MYLAQMRQRLVHQRIVPPLFETPDASQDRRGMATFGTGDLSDRKPLLGMPKVMHCSLRDPSGNLFPRFFLCLSRHSAPFDDLLYYGFRASNN